MSTEPTSTNATSPRGINRKYLRVQDLRRLRHLFFSARKAIEGQYSGQHATRQSGKSVEVRDYRQYMPGDEIGDIDWKIYGRSDKLFIKVYEHLADLTVHLLVDGSNSMAYRGADLFQPRRLRQRRANDKPNGSKYDYACSLAAAIAFLVIKQSDRVSFGLAQNGLIEFSRPGSSMVHLTRILGVMERNRTKGEARLPDAVRELTSQTQRRDLLIVFSDLMEDRDEILNALSMCIHRGGEVILFHVLHSEELRLPQIENGIFIDSETGAKLRLNVEDVRTAYDAQMKDFLDGWSRFSKSNGIDYSLCSTVESYHKILERYLTGRSVRM